MTNSVTFPVNLGGDGSTVTDDDNASTGLGNGGHRTRFVPAMGQIVAVANTLTQRLAEQSDTSTTSLAIATGSKSFVTAGFYEWAVGMYVVAASTSSPANRMYGQVTSWTTSTNTLVVNVLAIDGSGTFSSWTVSLSGPPNLTTLPNVISVDSTTAALRITQLGTGNALLVEDSSNPDATPFVIDANGNLGLGVTPSAWSTGYSAALQIGYGSICQLGGYDVTVYTNNAYVTSSGATWKYLGSSSASQYRQFGGQHQWYTAPSGTAGNTISFTQAMTLDASGNLGIGTTSPEGTIHAWVSSAGTVTAHANGNIGVFEANGSNGLSILVPDASSSLIMFGSPSSNRGAEVNWNYNSSTMQVGTRKTGGILQLMSGNASVGATLDSSGYLLVGYTSSNGAYKLQVNSQIFATSATIATSDANYKENVEPITNALNLVTSLNPVSFNWKEHPVHAFDKTTKVSGFLAQEVAEVLKDESYAGSIVKESECELPDGTKEKFLGIAEGNMIAILTAAIQELHQEIQELKQKVNA